MMDPSLIQLEKELFSLTPARPRRELVEAVAECMATAAAAAPAASVVRSVPVQRNVIPFQWRRITIPAAAAAAVVIGVQTEHPQSSRGLGVTGAAPLVKWQPSPPLVDIAGWSPADYASLNMRADEVVNAGFHSPYMQVTDDGGSASRFYWYNPGQHRSTVTGPVQFD